MSKQNNKVAIIGAGPAGLFCAYTLAHESNLNIVLFEKGKKISERYLNESEWNFKPNAVLEGEGGPGLLVDAKLCVSPSAGASFDRGFRDMYATAVEDIDFLFYAKLLEEGHEVRRFQPNVFSLTAWGKRLKNSDLLLESYPVRALGSDLARTFLDKIMVDIRKKKVDVRFQTEVIDILKKSNCFELTVQSDEGIITMEVDDIVLAVGRSGADWQSNLSIGMQRETNKLDIGVRLEFPKSGGDQLLELGENPKIKMFINGSYIKTHCLVHQGRVFSYLLGKDHCLVDAHSTQSLKSNGSSVNLLFRISKSQFENPKSIFKAISQTINGISFGKPIMMPLSKFLNRDNLLEDLSNFSPTLSHATETDFGFIFPEKITSSIKEFIIKLASFFPGIATNKSVLYGPCAEWLPNKILVDSNFRLKNKENVWCIGDGSGLTSGVLPAAALGVVAARQICSSDKNQLELIWKPPIYE